MNKVLLVSTNADEAGAPRHIENIVNGLDGQIDFLYILVVRLKGHPSLPIAILFWNIGNKYRGLIYPSSTGTPSAFKAFAIMYLETPVLLVLILAVQT